MAEDFLPFFKPDLSEEEIADVVDTLRSGWLTYGPKSQAFETEFAEMVGAKHAIAVNSCTAAMHLSLLASGVGPGDEVITTPITFASTANVIVHTGATPVLADVCADDYNIDPEDVARRITARTRALMPVHLAGQPCRMDELLEIARRHNLLVIEDGAHAHGAAYKGRPIGSIGDATCFSFYATKNMTTGEGGMIATNNDELAEKVRALRSHGLSSDAWKRYSASGSAFYEV
ncbi:MAG TPA: DegT/DnrJ/EryC1/StrS aminotransferase family protein, partial [Dehalococcoidia bacterium]|nr:DegT/DnrJ/EryC1/StrS aminotransferase family protein [Dehalococcoidia bacterium]